MKKALFLLSIFFLSLSVRSQISLQHTLSSGPFDDGLSIFSLSNLSQKYFFSTYNGTPQSIDTISIYNLDWSLYRQVILPNGYIHSGSASDKLFNLDTLIEFTIYKSLQNNGGNSVTISVINELGQIQYTFPDTDISNIEGKIIKAGNDFQYQYSTFSNQCKVFSLPGSLPCTECNSQISGIIEPNQDNGLASFNVYPNPFNNSLNIQYHFNQIQDNPRIVISDISGKELQTVQLSTRSGQMTINTSNLPQGNLIISLYGNGNSPISKKVVKVP